MEDSMYEIIVDSLSAHVAVLDSNGDILKTNRAWQQYAADNDMAGNPDSIGINYFSICEAATDSGDKEGELVAEGIRKILAGEQREFVIHYPCHSPTRHQWFNLRILPYLSAREHQVIVVHEDITPVILIQEELKKKEVALQQKGEKLTEINVALKVLLEHREQGLEELENRITANIRELVLPYVEKLKKSEKGERERILIDIIESNLNNIITPFLHRLSSLHLLLTPQEVEVAALIRPGKSSQEIADVLGVSVSTISFHRKNLRHKLGLNSRTMNLRTYLLSLK